MARLQLAVYHFIFGPTGRWLPDLLAGPPTDRRLYCAALRAAMYRSPRFPRSPAEVESFNTRMGCAFRGLFARHPLQRDFKGFKGTVSVDLSGTAGRHPPQHSFVAFFPRGLARRSRPFSLTDW